MLNSSVEAYYPDIMGTINSEILKSWGARGCSNSDYNLVETTCCNACLVEDWELNDLYKDPLDPSAVLSVWELAACPVCEAQEWDYAPLEEWPGRDTGWLWAQHSDID